MAENINILEIIKQCPEGTKFYCVIIGEGTIRINLSNKERPITIFNETMSLCLTKYGHLYEGVGDCILFPSKDQRNWNEFVIPKPDLPIDTPVAVSDNKVWWELRLYAGKGRTKLNKNAEPSCKWNYIAPLDKICFTSEMFIIEENYGTASGKWE